VRDHHQKGMVVHEKGMVIHEKGMVIHEKGMVGASVCALSLAR